MQQAFSHKEGGGDAVSCSTDTSRWSSPSRVCCGSNSSHYSSDFEDQADSLTDKNPEVKTSDKWQASKTCGRKKGILFNTCVVGLMLFICKHIGCNSHYREFFFFFFR